MSLLHARHSSVLLSITGMPKNASFNSKYAVCWRSFYSASFEKTPNRKQLCILDSNQIVKQGYWVGFVISFSKSTGSGELHFLLRET